MQNNDIWFHDTARFFILATSSVVAKNRKQKTWKKSCYFIKSNIPKSKQFCNSISLHAEKELRCVCVFFLYTKKLVLLCSIWYACHTLIHIQITLLPWIRWKARKRVYLFIHDFLLSDITIFSFTFVSICFFVCCFFPISIYFSLCFLDFYDVQIMCFFSSSYYFTSQFL